MKLNSEEQAILDGKSGPTMQKVMQTLLLYGQAVDATHMVTIEGEGHFSISGPFPGGDIPLYLLDELVDAGLKTKLPFTLNPKSPLDFENLGVTQAQKQEFKKMFRDETHYQRGMRKLGLRGRNDYTCSPYVFDGGNTPKRDVILAWSESSCVIYANSALGARTNRNAAIIDLLSNIIGKTPMFGLLTNEGRRANWRIDIETTKLPNPQLLGTAIGKRVQDGIPYICGLDRFFTNQIDERARDYLKEMGATCAAIGAIGLYHIENVTPEALDQGRSLLLSDHQVHLINDSELQELVNSYPNMWDKQDSVPEKVMIGCPHLSLRELLEWTDRISGCLDKNGREKIAIDTVLVAPPQVLQLFREQHHAEHQKLQAAGARLSATCCEAYMTNRLCSSEAVLTNSSKLRAYTNARLVLDEQLVETIVTGNMQQSSNKTQLINTKVKNPEEEYSKDLLSKTQIPPTQVINIEKKVTTFYGRPLYPDNVSGKALVTRSGFNSLASFVDAMVNNSISATCSDHDSLNLYGKALTGSILCIPKTVGSTSAGATWEYVARHKMAPAAVLFSEKIDSLAAAGMALAKAWALQPICVVDNLGIDFLNTVEEGQQIMIDCDGKALISDASGH